MKQPCFILMLVVLCASRSLVADEAARDFPQTAEGKVLARYLGQWHSELAITLPKERLQSRDSSVHWTLGGRWLLVSEKVDDGFQFLNLVNFDPLNNAYVAYIFDSGGRMLAASGKWDESASQMTWTYSSNGRIAVITNHFVGDELIESAEKVTDASGKIVHEMTEKRSRKSGHGEGRSATDAALSKQETASNFQETPEAKVLARYIGQWHSVLVFRGREKQIDYDTTWALRGRWLYAKITSNDGKEGLALTTFDSAQHAYVSWSFSSDSSVDVWKGMWDAEACRMTWTRRDAKGGVSDVDQFIDDDTIEIRSKNQDSSGRTLFEADEHVKRK